MNRGDSYQKRWERIQSAIALKRPDRVPVVLEYAGFAAHVTATPMSEFVASPQNSMEVMMRAFEWIGDGDAVNYGSFWPYGLSHLFLSRVSVPGVDLPDGEMWQVVESELMVRQDYDRILEVGWPAFFEAFMREKIFKDVPHDRRRPVRTRVEVREAWRKLGVPVLCGGDITTPMELLCGARSLTSFAFDLVEVPDKVKAVMDAIVPHLAGHAIERALRGGYPSVWVGGWRTAPCLWSHEMWNRFAWPYLRRLVQEVVDAGLVALLHLDSDWTRELERFREFPRGRCIVALDGETDIFRAKEILGVHLCLMGDVPAAMLYMGEPEAVHRYCRKLIEGLGPEGFILQSGCDIPTNARLENVQAMVEAATSGRR